MEFLVPIFLIGQWSVGRWSLHIFGGWLVGGRLVGWQVISRSQERQISEFQQTNERSCCIQRNNKGFEKVFHNFFQFVMKKSLGSVLSSRDNSVTVNIHFLLWLKELFLDLSENPQENNFAGASLSIKVQVEGLRLQLY